MHLWIDEYIIDKETDFSNGELWNSTSITTTRTCGSNELNKFLGSSQSDVEESLTVRNGYGGDGKTPITSISKNL